MSKVSTAVLPAAILVAASARAARNARTNPSSHASPRETKAAAIGSRATMAASTAPAPDTKAAADSKAATIAEKTKGAQKLAGYFNLYWDAKAGKLWLEIDKWGTEFLYQTSLPAGVGSNDIGLDRGQMGETRIVRFERIGPKILLIQSNLGLSRGHAAIPTSARPCAIRSRSRRCGVLRWRRKMEDGDDARSGGRDGVFPARRAPRPRNSGAHKAGRVQAR